MSASRWAGVSARHGSALDPSATTPTSRAGSWQSWLRRLRHSLRMAGKILHRLVLTQRRRVGSACSDGRQRHAHKLAMCRGFGGSDGASRLTTAPMTTSAAHWRQRQRSDRPTPAAILPLHDAFAYGSGRRTGRLTGSAAPPGASARSSMSTTATRAPTSPGLRLFLRAASRCRRKDHYQAARYGRLRDTGLSACASTTRATTPTPPRAHVQLWLCLTRCLFIDGRRRHVSAGAAGFGRADHGSGASPTRRRDTYAGSNFGWADATSLGLFFDGGGDDDYAAPTPTSPPTPKPTRTAGWALRRPMIAVTANGPSLGSSSPSD